MQGTNIPIINPEIVTGVSLMLLFVFFAARMNFEFGFVTLIIAHITFDVPYVIPEHNAEIQTDESASLRGGTGFGGAVLFRHFSRLFCLKYCRV